jgi:hypothetical protein
MSPIIAKDDIDIIIAIMENWGGIGICGYIDRETGQVLTDGQDELLEIIPNQADEDYAEKAAEFNRRYLPISQENSGDGYQEMVDFIETVEDERLRDRLGVAIQGQGAFGRFRDVLSRSDYESERNRWFTFSEKCAGDRAVAWLATQGFSVA